jgi:hypothetical protein
VRGTCVTALRTPRQTACQDLGKEIKHTYLRSMESRYNIVATSWFPNSSSMVCPTQMILSRYKQFQISTHCQLFSLGVLYGTRGTPIGIIVDTERLFLPELAPTASDARTVSPKLRLRRPATAVSVGTALSPEKDVRLYPAQGVGRTVRALPRGRTPTTGAHADIVKTLIGP